MYQIFSRKILLFTIFWIGIFSFWPQTQAVACWWNCCCCCHQEDTPPTVTHKQPLINHEKRSDQPRDQQSGYGAMNSQPHSLAQTPQQDSVLVQASRPLITEERSDAPTIVTLLPSSQQVQRREEPSLLSSASLVTISLDPSHYLEWAADTFKSTSCRKIWTVNSQIYGDTIFGDEELPLALDNLVKVVFPQIPQNIWESYALSQRLACKKLLYNKVVHYALDAVRGDVEHFVTAIEALWEEAPQACPLAHFQFRMKESRTRYWYFFAKKGSRILYIRTPYIEGINDQKTGSQSTTRSSSRAVSIAPTRQSSPKKEKEKEERKVSVQDKKSGTNKSNTGNDSDE